MFQYADPHFNVKNKFYEISWPKSFSKLKMNQVY